MGVDSNVFVVADKQKALEIGQAVFNAIETWQRRELDQYVKDNGWNSRLQFLFSNKNAVPSNPSRRMWSNGAKIQANSFDFFQIVFDYNGENRTLWYFTNCSCDTDHITKDHTLLFSIGNWGSNRKIMQVVIDALRPFGPVYYDHNDCDDEDYVLQ